MKQIQLPDVTVEVCKARENRRAGSREALAVEEAIERRNNSWKNCSSIPSWVDRDHVGLDCFYTRPEVAKECSDNLIATMRADGADIRAYDFVDPGAGKGVFYDLMPTGRRTGIDVLPTRAEFVAHDYLTWMPRGGGGKYAILGNPPFGYRAWLALAFLNHSAQFADYMGLILPMAFQSDGKGSPKHRVRGAELVHSNPLTPSAFLDQEGNAVKLNALWQVWRRGVNNIPAPRTCDSWIDLFTVDNRKERLCGQARLHEADFFLQRTYYGEPPKLVKDFTEVRYGCGYGIVLKKQPETIRRLLNETDWREFSNLAMHNCRHISMYHIRRAVIQGGFTDD